MTKKRPEDLRCNNLGAFPQSAARRSQASEGARAAAHPGGHTWKCVRVTQVLTGFGCMKAADSRDYKEQL